MKIAILGAGNIGGTLGRKWAKAGHRVILGVRDVNSPKTQTLLQSISRGAKADTVASAIAFGDVVLLSVPNAAVDEIIDTHAKLLDGKIIIDATNNFGKTPISCVEALQTKTPSAKIFRAFNSLGWESFAEPQFGSLQADLFYCGAAGEVRPVVETLISEVGLRPVCLGGLDQVSVVDSIGVLWVRLVFGQGLPRHLAFKMLT
jgi:predicted dinucleotide-binding enzyme